MLAFLDESRDSGRKTTSGSSNYFVIILDNEEALACDQRIELLRTELNLTNNYEFHFANNSNRVREAFLKAVNPYNFSIVTVSIDKDISKLFGVGINVKSSFYKYACQMVLTNAMPYLDKAKLVIDKSGGDTFQGKLRKYLRQKLNDEEGQKICNIKAQESSKNNLQALCVAQ